MPDKPHVFISRTIPAVPLQMIEAACDVVLWDADIPPPRPQLLDQLALADGALLMLTEIIDREALDAAPTLRVVSNYAVGYDNIDVALATERGIPIGHTPGVLTATTADHAFMLLMAIARRLPESMRYIDAGQWRTWNPTTLLGRDVNGATLGIIGLGRIGFAMAKRAQGFAMRVLYHGGEREEFTSRVRGRHVELDTLLRESDFVSLHVPLTEATHHLLGEREFVLMKRDAMLINTARGAVVDTTALVKALKRGMIGGAALDVTDPEPLPVDHALLGLPNCIVTPHTGSATHATRELMGKIAAENLLAGLRGDPLPHCVNPKVYRDV
jgi:glyoxylate reductase